MNRPGSDHDSLKRRVARVGFGLLIAVVALASSGCMHVIAYPVAYYKDGPSQLDPPQGSIAKGTPVMLLGRDGSYIRVLTPDFTDGYVWHSAVRAIWELGSAGADEGAPVFDPGPAEPEGKRPMKLRPAGTDLRH